MGVHNVCIIYRFIFHQYLNYGVHIFFFFCWYIAPPRKVLNSYLFEFSESFYVYISKDHGKRVMYMCLFRLLILFETFTLINFSNHRQLFSVPIVMLHVTYNHVTSCVLYYHRKQNKTQEKEIIN